MNSIKLELKTQPKLNENKEEDRIKEAFEAMMKRDQKLKINQETKHKRQEMLRLKKLKYATFS